MSLAAILPEPAATELADPAAVESAMITAVNAVPGPASAICIEHLSSGGSRTRARLGLQTALALGVPAGDAIAAAAVAELLHNASLIHDDIQDGDCERRGKASVWAQHGRDIALCTGDLMISAAYGALAASPRCAQALPIVHRAVSLTIRGQCADLAARGSDRLVPSTYRAIAAEKSGPLIGLPLALAFAFAGRSAQIAQAEEAGLCVAVAYQILDDIDDAKTDGQAPNAVIAFGRTGDASGTTPSLAYRAAIAAAHGELDRAETIAASWPHGAGQGLTGLIERLRQQLAAAAHAY